ncbi:MAG: hypothetical protein K5880_09695 [Hydrogenophaga sp.]|uniref:hypothetical protein n=1 Tax=Hydrogenophaga sp. TaxID=1904254 RepID=UPI00262AFF35|nr:hypothetical protein [Hydrogenophaga sp.]MCV0438893.1 hypothetical protein [Hydrogenophaga sp.]
MIAIFGGLALGEAIAASDLHAGFNWDLLLILNSFMLAVCLLVRYLMRNPD